MRSVLAILILLTIAVPCLSGTVPSVTAQVNINGDQKEYMYTLLNDLDSHQPITKFVVLMPEYGARAVIGATVSRSNWQTGWGSKGGYAGWSATPWGGAELPAGETLVFTLTTRASLPTSYNYIDDPSGLGNWMWGVPEPNYGDSSLPVPVPEPSALLALAGALGALGLPLLRGRKQAASIRHRDPLV